MIFLKISSTFYDDAIYRDDSYIWSNKKIKIEAKDLSFKMVTWVDSRVPSDSMGVEVTNF